MIVGWAYVEERPAEGVGRDDYAGWRGGITACSVQLSDSGAGGAVAELGVDVAHTDEETRKTIAQIQALE